MTPKTLQQHRAGLTVSRQIMKTWGIEDSRQGRVLNIDQSILDLPEICDALTDDQLVRISYLLNIHASLKEIFENAENHYGFMTAVNHNPPYNGQRPLDFVLTGKVDSLKRVFESLKRINHGQW
ncbi:hypothetical protein [Marinobacter sp.]|uniref:hypothetical protein n=1 Tax=Marinobacter sp. TaxID=50741 RepID=UPI0035C73C37